MGNARPVSKGPPQHRCCRPPSSDWPSRQSSGVHPAEPLRCLGGVPATPFGPAPGREQLRTTAQLAHRLPRRTAGCGDVSEAPRVRAAPQRRQVQVQGDPNSPVSVNFQAMSLSFTLSP
jgi:hypothetical protein